MPDGRDLTDDEFVEIRRAIKGAMLRLGRSRDYNDIYQTCWVAILTAMPRFDPRKGKLGTFAYDIAKGAMLDRWEKESRRARLLHRVPLEDHMMIPAPHVESNLSEEEEARLWAAIDSIKPCLARAIVDRYANDMTVSAVADRAGVVLRTAETYLLKAKKALRAKLGEENHKDSKDVA